MLYDNVAPITVVGFQITNSKSVMATTGNWNSEGGMLTLLDGQIGINSATNLVAIDNSYGKSIYVRNIYVSGTTNLVRSSTTKTSGKGTWSLIKEYSYNNSQNVANVPPNTAYDPSNINTYQILETYSLINGTNQDQTVAFPVPPNVVTNTAAPPADLVSRHLWKGFPSYNGATNDSATVVVNIYAGLNNTNDDTIVLQAAINQAKTNNGQVFLPSGGYFITNTLTLYSNTVLMGAGWEISKIDVNPSWKPMTGEVTMLQTEDYSNAVTTLAWLTVQTRRAYTANETNYSRFNALNWRAGAQSLVLNAEMAEPYNFYTNTQPRSHIKVTGNGGGRWYTMGADGYWAFNQNFHKVSILNTTQPLWFYGFNIEHGGDNDAEVLVSGANNVRMLGLKREGGTPLLVITNSSNIAAYSGGAMRWQPVGNGYFQVLGNSTNILFGNIGVQDLEHSPQLTDYLVYEALTGQPVKTVTWPNMVSLYKRGELNDAAMFISLPPEFAQPRVVGGILVLTGTGGSAGGSYRMFTTTNVALPFANWTPVLTNTFASDGSFSNTIPFAPSATQSFYHLIVP